MRSSLHVLRHFELNVFKPLIAANVLQSARLIGEADFFAHRLYGEPTELGTFAVDPRLRRAEVFHPFPILPRKLYVEWAPFFGVIRAGQQASHWGLGLVANGGERSDKLFGESYRGSLSERLLFATSPFQALGALPDSVLGRFTLLAAADLVLADETALHTVGLDGDESSLGVRGHFSFSSNNH